MDNEILNRLKEFITFKGWSKAEFARRVNIKPQHVNKYLSGELDVQNLLLNLYNNGCDINWLIGGKEQESRGGEEYHREIEHLRGEIEKLKHELAKREGQIELLKSMLREAERAKGGDVVVLKGAGEPKLKEKS